MYWPYACTVRSVPSKNSAGTTGDGTLTAALSRFPWRPDGDIDIAVNLTMTNKAKYCCERKRAHQLLPA